MSRQCMCGCDVHLAWKSPVSLEACRGLRTAGGHLAVDTFVTLEFSSNTQISDCHLRTMWSQFRSRLSLESLSWRRVGGRLIRADSYPSSDSSVEMSDELASTLASIQEFMAGVSRRLDQIESSRQDPHPAGMVTDETIPHASQTAQAIPPRVSLGYSIAEQEAKVERLESMMRQIRLQDGGLTWDDRDGIPAASLPAKFRMPDIERYSGIGCPKIHLRLYSTVMRAHGIDDAQLVALFPMSLSGTAQSSLSALTLMYPDESWRPLGRGQMSLFLLLSLVGGQRWLDLRSLVQAAFSVEEAIARGLWTDTTPSPDSKGKKLMGPFSRSGEYQYQPDYAQEPYIAQTSTQPRPPHQRATTHPLPRPYAQRPARQFTPLGMTLTRAFEKLRDAGVIVPLAPRPLPHPIPPPPGLQ
ncbi:hypothetical protein CK203_063902 [Vitis vinifera]|uniref:Uncharacterized protein n=1 Tax=Vitis vinifera TaxID=29760 RepID=A0A438FRB3_VITVI|nr:hypothetical protein CK203_063902 [Vitis vinifera]